MDKERAKRRAEFEAEMRAQPCSACWHDEHPNAPIFDCAGMCENCGDEMSISYLHSCKTGWQKRVCSKCNSASSPNTGNPAEG